MSASEAKRPKKPSPSSMLLARRAGGALGTAYAMRDRNEPMRDVRAQLREARALVAAERFAHIPD